MSTAKEMVPEVYEDLRRVAHRPMTHEREGHTFSRTDLSRRPFPLTGTRRPTMTVRNSLKFLALTVTCAAGCGSARLESREAAPLIAYTRASSDVATSGPARGLVVTVEPFRDGTLHDPALMMDLRLSIERQISAQVAGLSNECYRTVARPRVVTALRTAGLEQADVDYILRGVDYHRSL
jgi:hypothetical protein